MNTQIIKTYGAFGRYIVRRLDANGKLVQATLNVCDCFGNLVTVL